MVHFENKKQLLNATDEEIKEFFKDSIFRGSFITSNDDNVFCGKLENITLNGTINDLCPSILYVPTKFARYVKEGLCEFVAVLNLSAFKTGRHPYKLIITNIHAVEQSNVVRDTQAENRFRYNLKLKDDKFIGQFTENKDGSFTIRDIRRSDFSKLILQNGKEQAPILYHPQLFKPKNGIYYEFSWVLNGQKDNYVYLFKVDESKPFQEVFPKNLIQRLHDDIMNYPPGAGQKIVKMLDTLKNQLTASGKEIFIYELLQNANDYPLTIDNVKQKVEVEFHLTQSSLIFMHSGAVFSERNIAAICSINDKEKDTNKDAIGYKGIGFKTVFLDNDNVYLQTGNYSFRFDRQATKDVVDTPWQILPIWTKYQELTSAERAIFTQAGDEFRVKFALKPTKFETLRDSENNYEDMFRDIFKNERVILFIPNLSSVKIFLKGTPIPDIVCSRDNDIWRVDDFNEKIDESITKAINADIDEQEDTGGLKIPTKYYNFKNTKVSFACLVDGRKLKSVKDTCLYCYLPAKDATWGLKFLMNTDMIPNGARDDIEVDFSNSTNVNEAIANIAGSKLFEWILKLSKSGEYDMDSIYDLIPNFASLKNGRLKYKELINSFENGFTNRVEKDELIPTKDGYISLLNVVVDETGITSSGIMTDEDFLKFSDNSIKSLPAFELRDSKAFKSFAELYLRKFDAEDNIFDLEGLHNMVGKPAFQKWLMNQDNNNRFLNFLLEKGYLGDFINEEIFIENECGELYSSEDLCYNIDEELKDLSAFSNHISYLSLNTREYFQNNEDWDNIINGRFAEFDGDNFINETLLNENWNETTKALENWDTSFHFYSYLAKNNIIPNELKDLPFFNDESIAEVVEDFNDKFIFISSEEGKATCAASWLTQITFAFVSPNYDEATLEYFKENAGVLDYSDDVIVNDIILSDVFQEEINASQQDDHSASKSFVRFCYEHESLFGTGSLKEYALNSADCVGDNSFVLSEEHIYFPSEYFDKYSKKEWVYYDWMYCLDSDYLKIDNDQEKVKAFLKKTFYIEELDASRFYKDIVKNKITDIIDNTSGCNDSDGNKNLDFVSYLDDNYKLIFEEEKDAEAFSSIVLLGDSDDDSLFDIASDSSYVYAYNEELKDILDSNWFPINTVNMCTKKYGESKAIIAIKAKNYNFNEFFDDVIFEELENINETIDSKESSIAFHSFVVERLRSLTDQQKEVMKKAKVYLYGSDDCCECSEGHKILSKSARELSAMGLVEFADLDIIDPDYHIEDNEDYWKKHLGNELFTVLDFFKWLNENSDTFYETIEDKDNNIKFWRWVRGCQLEDSTLKKLPVLPIYLNTDEFIGSDEIIYLSDNYIEEGGIETIVKNYHPEASFVSAEYIEENDNIENWKKFWVKLGMRFEMVDILIDTIDNRLNETDDEKLPGTLAKYRSKLDEHYEGELISKLTNLRVKAHDGEFYNLDETIYIYCEKDEPFPYIKLPNQISFDTPEQRKLIKDILSEINGDCIETLSEWQQRKVDCYLEMQDDDCELVRDFHYKFIDELSIIRNTDKDSLKEIEHIENIYLLNRENKFCEPASLTMGSVYNPFFNFEKCGITSLEYVSDLYKLKCAEYPGRLFRALKVHYDIQKEDLCLLENRTCAIYFWNEYLVKKEAAISRIKEFLSDNLFDDIDCIPTKDFMKSPKDLYYGNDVCKYVKYIEDWENKTPHKDIPEIKFPDGTTVFSKLPFKESLDFLDALYALVNISGQEKRIQLLKWLVDDYDSAYDNKINEYREDEHALWYNNRNEQVHIKDLYALNYEEKSLEQYFGQNSRIINKAYFPASIDHFKSACNILGIKTISLSDLKMTPLGDTVFTQKNNDLKLFALVIAGMIDAEGWQDLYNGFVERINTLVLHRCESIMITYKEDESINQSLRKFYHETGSNDFYFVNSLDGKRVYTLFVKDFTEFIGINKDDIPQEMIEDIMDSRENALELIREQNMLMLDDAFKNALDELIPGIKRELNGNEAEEDDDETSVTYRPTFTTTDTENEDYIEEELTPDEIDDTTDSDVSELPVNYGQSTNPNSSVPLSDIPQQYDDNVEDVELRRQRSDKGYAHDYPTTREKHERKSPINTNPIKAGEGVTAYNDMKGWEGSSRSYNSQAPKPFSPEDVRNFGSRGVTRVLEVLEPTTSEIDEINRILGEDLSSEQIADQNYLAQLRLYNNLVKRGMVPDESKEDFVRNAHMKDEHTTHGGKYIHKCSAAGGIMYLSPKIWNKIADDRCVVCVYLGAKSNEFMYFNSKEDILKWIGEDDILIKLTGEEKADVVEELYSGVLDGVKGTAYTLIRINSNEKYNSLFAQLPANSEINETEENENEY